MDKYKELYAYSKEVLNEELGRFNRIDEKASKYLSALTLVAGASAFFGKWVIDNLIPPKTYLEWALVLAAALLGIAIFVSWILIFNSLRLHSLIKPPLNAESIKFFNDNEMIDIYYALAKGNKEALEKNRATTDSKSKKLYQGYLAINISGIILVVFLLIFIVYSWNNPKTITQNERGAVMTKDKNQGTSVSDESVSALPSINKQITTDRPSPDKPNPNIVPPKYDIITEGYNPSNLQKRQGDTDKEK